MELTEIVEALLFATQEPLSAKEIASAIKTTVKENEGEPFDAFKKVNEKKVNKAIDSLIKSYEESGRAFTLVERPTGWRIYARPDYAVWIRALMPAKRGSRLSPPAMETLAIVAYRQPITKAHIESVRGVAVDGVLQTLLDRNLVRIGGRADLPGRPLLYETSELFLEYFGITNLDDLPNSAELRRVELPQPETEKEEEKSEEQLSMADLENGDKAKEAKSDEPSDEKGADKEEEKSEVEEAEAEEAPSEDDQPEGDASQAEDDAKSEQPTA